METKYVVVKMLSGRPNEGNRGSSPDRAVVMSHHSRPELAESAKRRYQRDHCGYATFAVEQC